MYCRHEMILSEAALRDSWERFLRYGESFAIEHPAARQDDPVAHSGDDERYERASVMRLVHAVCYPRSNVETVREVKVKMGRSSSRANGIVTSSCDSQPAWTEISRANAVIRGWRSLHPCDECLWENEDVMFHPHPGAASMLTP